MNQKIFISLIVMFMLNFNILQAIPKKPSSTTNFLWKESKFGIKTSGFFSKNLGLFYEKKISDEFSLQLGVYYDVYKEVLFDIDKGLYEEKVKLPGYVYSFEAISIPLLAKFYVQKLGPMHLSYFIGISPAILIEGETYIGKKRPDIAKNLISGNYDKIEKDKKNSNGDPLLNAIAYYLNLGLEIESYGFIFGEYLTVKLSNSFINFDANKYQYNSSTDFLCNVRIMIGYNFAYWVNPNEYILTEQELKEAFNLVAKNKNRNRNNFDDLNIKFGIKVGQSLYTGQYGGFFEYKPASFIGLQTGLSWGYMSYGIIPSQEKTKEILDSVHNSEKSLGVKSDDDDKIYIPMEVVKVSSLSIPLIINFYASSNQLSFFGGAKFSMLTSIESGLFRHATEEASIDYLSCGLQASNDCYDSERNLNSGELEDIDIDKDINILGEVIPLRRAQVSWLIGFNYESTYGTIWGMKYERAITSFIDYQNNNLNEAGNWSLVMELGYNFARIL